MALGAAAASIVRCSRQQVRVLGDAPAPDDGDDGADRERAGAAARAASDEDERGGAAQQRRDHERQPSPVRPS